jgi:hypothetical protein
MSLYSKTAVEEVEEDTFDANDGIAHSIYRPVVAADLAMRHAERLDAAEAEIERLLFDLSVQRRACLYR